MVLWMREFNKSGKGRVEFTGFDMQTPGVAAGIVSDFVGASDPDYAASVRQAKAQAEQSGQVANGFGVATARFPVKDAAGKHVRFSGYIKTKGVSSGFAGLWWRVDGPSGILAFDNMQSRGVTGTTDWKRYDIELPVAANATNINFGALLAGTGTAWFDGLSVELDGKPYLDTNAFDLDFESSPPRGFYTGGAGYSVQPDSETFHDGKQSLRMTHEVSANKSNSGDPKAASSTWTGIVRHLEDARQSYIKKGIAPRDIEWAVQNARVVLQCMQLKSGEVTRDQSMADNVKWILDNNPGARIVLWAHNGHVATAGGAGFVPMGVSLRKMFGTQMVVFGFAFNQGSFQAIEPNKGLHDFTVGPAPPGSLDATLGATGIPLFAVDLRGIPKSSPVGSWLSEPHSTRSIGSTFSQESGDQFMFDMKTADSFDAILFVEKTTAARRNP